MHKDQKYNTFNLSKELTRWLLGATFFDVFTIFNCEKMDEFVMLEEYFVSYKLRDSNKYLTKLSKSESMSRK